ncbi:hypothetical protein B9479_006239 [Cryptococcus floricola]|uniref:Uncharacterized protein n=1 Tax=Cryptococcus floricola TaxID=2591691 RepID=A0A5D3ANM5_9TREE|nr:hypothetical protein B9479_006239 [Cryptococcus floricola]
MPVSTPADSNASKDTQSTLFPPDSRISDDSSRGPNHMCYCPMHLQPGESNASWTGGKPMIFNDAHSARIHFNNRDPTIFELSCASTAIILSFRDDDPAEDEMLVGILTKSELDNMGLWPSCRDGFKTATGVECGVLVGQGREFENMFDGNPIMEINRSVSTDTTYTNAIGALFSRNTVKKEFKDKAF